jgi:hypothetical protein
MQLMSAEERRTLDDLAGVMFSLGLSFKFASKDGGKAQLCLEPRVDDLVRCSAKLSSCQAPNALPLHHPVAENSA